MKKQNKKIKLHFFAPDGEGDGFDEEFLSSELREMYKGVCKPCWELRYCPFGPLVEGFPLPPIPRHVAIEHNDYLKKCLDSKRLGDGTPLDSSRRKLFEKEIESFDPNSYSEDISDELVYMSCGIFGHLCPVFFNGEGFTETQDGRSQGRQIPRDILIRVVRRDDSTCQECSRKVLEKDIEIDHIIPLSRGGATIESNLRVLCKQCNKSKSDKDPDTLLGKHCRYLERLNFYKRKL